MRHPESGALSLSILVLVACGGGDGTAPPPPPPPPAVATIEVTGSPSVVAGADVQLTATAKTSAGATLNNVSFTWETSANTVATVSGTGLVHGVSSGTADITARAEGKVGTLALTVIGSGPLPEVLSGMITRVDLTIAENETYQVTGNTALVVDSTFIMAGTLVIAPGASLTLYGGKLLRITGILDGDSAAEFVIGGGAVEIGEDVAPAASAPRSMMEQIKGDVGGSGPTYFSSKSIVVKRSGLITAGDGEQGTKENRDGGRGHNVEIGTPLARSKLNDKAGKPPSGVESLVVEGKIIGGLGGEGFHVQSRADGEAAGNKLTAHSGRGGPGGDVILVADRIDLKGGVGFPVLAGYGGSGGVVVIQDLRSGSGPNLEGESLDAVAGSGGRSGNLTVTTPLLNAAPGTVQRAPGGPAGRIYLEGGNGINGGDGGNLVVVAGARGERGTVSVPAGVAVGDESDFDPPEVGLSNAIRGGHSEDFLRPGGDGGYFSLSGPAGAPALIKTLTFDNVGNGGLGFDGCEVTPVRNGTDGGDGGQRELVLWAGPFPAAAQIKETGSNFNGGIGGPGLPGFGQGGSRGQQIQGPGGPMPIGEAGPPGFPCPITPLAFHRTAVANPATGISSVSVGTTVQSATTLALPGAATVERFENDPTTLVAGTLTNPSLTTIAVGGDGTMTAVDTRPMTSAVFGIATALECVLAVQPSKLLFFDKELNLITETSVPSITNVLAHNTVVYAHAGNDILFFTIDPVTCTGSPTENPPIAVPNLRDFEVSEEGDLFLGLERPLAGPSRLHVFPADGGVPTGGATIVTLPGSAFDVEITPGGNRAYLMGDLGQVTWATVEKANATVSVQGQFTLSGADRFELVDAAGEPQLRTTAAAPGEVRIIYTRVSNPSLGQLCTAVLGTDGVPKAAAVCEEGSTRPRPDSDLRVLKPAPAALRTAFPVGRRASR